MEFEIIEEYFLDNEHRFRVKLKGSRLIFNVSAITEEEALKKAKKMYKLIIGKIKED